MSNDALFKIDDSGKRVTTETGAQRERADGKGRYDLISPFFLKRLAIRLELGAAKYKDRNWEKGLPFSWFLDATLRHIEQWLMGSRDEDHLAAAAFNIMGIMHLQETHPEMNDIPLYLHDIRVEVNPTKEAIDERG